jgi:hypothetical protein
VLSDSCDVGTATKVVPLPQREECPSWMCMTCKAGIAGCYELAVAALATKLGGNYWLSHVRLNPQATILWALS